MSTRNRILIFSCLFILAAFLIGTARLFELRFKSGDVYPPYSSLRADPLGSKAYFEGLASIESLTVSRNFRSISRLGSGRGITFFLLGMHEHDLKSVPENYFKAITHFVASGGRLAISFFPVKKRSAEKKNHEQQKQDAEKAETDEHASKTGCNGQTESDLKKPQDRFSSLIDYWGVNFNYRTKPWESKQAARAAEAYADELPEFISSHTALFFDELGDAWNPVYSRDGLPVLIERRFGSGTVVFVADSYLFSNEALLKDRHPGLLTWLIGGNRSMVFDESHLGIQESAGVAGLARKYRLQWFFFGLVIVSGLFVWKNSAVFVPPPDDDSRTAGRDLASERDYTAGLVSLLRRNISSRDILGVCFREWEKSSAADRKRPDEMIKQVKAVIDTESQPTSHKADPVKGYQAICEICNRSERP
ncbi:MAG: DUF4350 domain-containing protein, partial [Thermodesulfobacteriota bacterium]|nr:DUF4350 domain-containing protein [Thermodesulfobacteriota bacterium]